MNLLVTKEGYIVLYAPRIEFGIYDEPFEKWALFDENNNITMYAIDNGYVKEEVDSLPEDYQDGKYFYINGEFVLNADWEPPTPEPSLEEFNEYKNRVFELEKEVAITELTMIENYEAQEEINAQTENALIEIYEMMEG